MQEVSMTEQNENKEIVIYPDSPSRQTKGEERKVETEILTSQDSDQPRVYTQRSTGSTYHASYNLKAQKVNLPGCLMVSLGTLLFFLAFFTIVAPILGVALVAIGIQSLFGKKGKVKVRKHDQVNRRL